LRIKGKIEEFTPTGVSGWLTAFGTSDDRIRLELLLDGVPVSSSYADTFRPDVAALGFGDGACHFKIVLPKPLNAAEAARLRLRIAHTDLFLELPRPETLAPEPICVPENSRDGAAVDGILKVFIVGSPRSGTSALLRAMQTVFALRAHGESHVMPAVAQAIHSLRLYYTRFKSVPNDLLIHQLPMGHIEAPLLEGVRAFYHKAYEGEGWADKTPTDEAVHSAPIILKVFPDARLIVTRRNGIEVVESYRKKFNAPFRDACENWARVMEGTRLIHEHCPDILEVDQFDLANAPVPTGQRIAEYLGQPKRGPQLGAFLTKYREDRLSTHDWAARLTLKDVDWEDGARTEFIRICGPLMAAAGYSM
jgi:hypothetical protein